mmetsp:Transcript_102055/g.288193  ORF Transcript_102055/g.288193 Transcript_102055/m.288193 type:complete len:275 (-) Transcript_102055:571-1395(-)
MNSSPQVNISMTSAMPFLVPPMISVTSSFMTWSSISSDVSRLSPDVSSALKVANSLVQNSSDATVICTDWGNASSILFKSSTPTPLKFTYFSNAESKRSHCSASNSPKMCVVRMPAEVSLMSAVRKRESNAIERASGSASTNTAFLNRFVRLDLRSVSTRRNLVSSYASPNLPCSRIPRFTRDWITSRVVSSCPHLPVFDSNHSDNVISGQLASSMYTALSTSESLGARPDNIILCVVPVHLFFLARNSNTPRARSPSKQAPKSAWWKCSSLPK